MISQDITAVISPKATKRSFQKRTVLLYQGEAPRMAYVVSSGLVKMYSINNSGEEQVVSIMGKDDIFPSTWIFNKTTTTLYYYETLTDSEILTLPREELSQALMHPDRLLNTLDYYVTNHAGLMMRITALEQSRAREKIMFTLYYLIFRYGKQISPGIYMLDFPLTHKIIASMVGLTRETTSGEISRLKRQKVLWQQDQTYIIDKSKLERLVGEDMVEDLSVS